MPIGFHVSKDGREMSEALAEDMEFLKGYGFTDTCAQIFVVGRQNYKETIPSEDKAAVVNVINRMRFTLVIHGSYADFPWNLKSCALHNIKQELKLGRQLGAAGVVVHLGAGAAEVEVLRKVLAAVCNLDLETKRSIILFLEVHSAKPGAGTFETPKKIMELFDRVGEIMGADPMQIGFCIDTAHLFSCGVSLATREAAERWLAGIANLKRPVMMHLNDSASILGSGRDLHETLCEGNIWREYHPVKGTRPFEESGLAYILSWADKNKIITILERDEDGLRHDLTLISRLGYFCS